jgi:hypothetical protein
MNPILIWQGVAHINEQSQQLFIGSKKSPIASIDLRNIYDKDTWENKEVKISIEIVSK